MGEDELRQLVRGLIAQTIEAAEKTIAEADEAYSQNQHTTAKARLRDAYTLANHAHALSASVKLKGLGVETDDLRRRAVQTREVVEAKPYK